VEVAGLSPADRVQRLALYITDHLRSSEGKKFFQAMATVHPEDKEKVFRSELDANGITTCPFLELLKPTQ
jgi:hypothetical protein